MRLGALVGLIFAAVAAVPVLAAPRAEHIGTYLWQDAGAGFGGLSGFDLADDGARFVVVSDRGAVFAGRLARGDDGAVTSVTITKRARLRGPGEALTGHKNIDAEGVALDPKGGFFVSFEQRARILHYAAPGAAADREIRPQVFAAYDNNFAFEALAIAQDGTLFTIPERPPGLGLPFPVFRVRGAVVDQPFTLPRIGGWAVSGADFGPDGRLYLLERGYWPLLGFMNRIRRVTLAGDRVVADEVILETQAGDFDNLEGMAVWRDARGAIRLTLVSDDNFSPLQKTELVDFRVTE
ncbi:MAG: esterase-like activity of phytase family protein [Defluviimonas sp.]|uniref:esterase-like activity of phytase family protein n=1 Tax=Albidovulum sp. TaxID=1872424 RepID=UPI001E0C6B1E|nr:esterase-like activity of phytase family protein [Paracoccaceae bacterium]MCC0063324.1 esterase-like activity of phytase family protein [Defluviimonas sp.]